MKCLKQPIRGVRCFYRIVKTMYFKNYKNKKNIYRKINILWLNQCFCYFLNAFVPRSFFFSGDRVNFELVQLLNKEAFDF